MTRILALALGVTIGTVAVLILLNLRPARVPAHWAEPDDGLEPDPYLAGLL